VGTEIVGDVSKPIIVNECVWNLIPAYIASWGELYGHYTNGFLLSSGGIENQDVKYLKMMTKFRSAYNRATQERMDTANKGGSK